MSLSSARQRRPTAASPLTDDGYSKDAKDRRRRPGGEEGEEGIRWFLPFLALGLLRHMSASSNLIHDCDEVFNYWEPLHFLLYRSGFQTWEYSSNFALRSYLYLVIHALVAGPASLIFGEHKVRVFYSVRIFLGLISTITETVLVVALSRRYGKRLACYVLAMLCLTSGCFFASTSFLPSSFSMYAVTLSSALFLLEKYAGAVSVAAAGVILGWPFSILVFLPVTIYSLIRGPFKRVFLSGLLTSLCILVLSLVADYYCYGRWTSSVFNLLKYNVLGGGESHLYGTEGPSFYFRNGFNNFNFAFILALLFLGVAPYARKKYAPDLLIVVSPVYIWLAFMSLQAHKEERFLYPIYPLICVAAVAVIDSFPDFFSMTDIHLSSLSLKSCCRIAKGLRPLILGFIFWTLAAVVGKTQRDWTRSTSSKVPKDKWRLLHHIPTLQELQIFSCDYLASLPESMRHLTTLRSLELRFCHNISVLPEWMGDLTSVESLEIIECQRLKSLPQCAQQLTMLKKLEIRYNPELRMWCESDENKIKLAHIKDISYADCDPEWYSLSMNDSISLHLFMFSDVNTCGNLHQLEDVHLNELQISCLEDVRFLEEARKIKLLDRQSLSKLTLEWTSDDDRILEDEDVLGELVPPGGLQHLKLDGYSSMSFPTWFMGISQYLPNLIEIKLEDLLRCNNLPPLGQLPNLEELHLRRLHSITKIDRDFCGGKGAFLRLSTFWLEDMERLEAWNTTYCGEDGMEEFMFPELDTLYVWDCPKLRLTPCPPIFRWWGIQKSDEVLSSWSEGDHVSRSPSDTQGTALNVCSSKGPVGEWRLLNHLSTLQKLNITNCDKLTSLPKNIQHLASLKSLVFYRCDGMSVLPEWLGHLTSLEILKINKCRSIKSLPRCIQQLTKLKKLKIVDNPELRKWCESEDNKMKLAHIEDIKYDYD